jgi:hypothetical protein
LGSSNTAASVVFIIAKKCSTFTDVIQAAKIKRFNMALSC